MPNTTNGSIGRTDRYDNRGVITKDNNSSQNLFLESTQVTQFAYIVPSVSHIQFQCQFFEHFLLFVMNDTLGLDWDGVISHFPQEIRLLAAKFTNVVIITLNKSISPAQAEEVLGREARVEICPDDERENHGLWKAKVCRQYNVALMIDDDGFVVAECRSVGIPALAVNAMFFQTMLYEF